MLHPHYRHYSHCCYYICVCFCLLIVLPVTTTTRSHLLEIVIHLQSPNSDRNTTVDFIRPVPSIHLARLRLLQESTKKLNLHKNSQSSKPLSNQKSLRNQSSVKRLWFVNFIFIHFHNHFLLLVSSLAQMHSTINSGKEEGNKPVEASAENQEPPEFSELFHDKRVQPGEKAVFQCEVIGEPEPTVEWMNGKEGDGFSNKLTPDHPRVKSGEIKVCRSGRKHWLEFPKASEELVGRYSVLAENHIGRAICSACLSVGGPDQYHLTASSSELRSVMHRSVECLSQSTHLEAIQTTTERQQVSPGGTDYVLWLQLPQEQRAKMQVSPGGRMSVPAGYQHGYHMEQKMSQSSSQTLRTTTPVSAFTATGPATQTVESSSSSLMQTSTQQRSAPAFAVPLKDVASKVGDEIILKVEVKG